MNRNDCIMKNVGPFGEKEVPDKCTWFKFVERDRGRNLVRVTFYYSEKPWEREDMIFNCKKDPFFGYQIRYQKADGSFFGFSIVGENNLMEDHCDFVCNHLP